MGVLTMLSKDVGRALKGYCPQPIREGLVSACMRFAVLSGLAVCVPRCCCLEYVNMSGCDVLHARGRMISTFHLYF